MPRDIRANPRPINRNALALEGGEFPARNLTFTPLKVIAAHRFAQIGQLSLAAAGALAQEFEDKSHFTLYSASPRQYAALQRFPLGHPPQRRHAAPAWLASLPASRYPRAFAAVEKPVPRCYSGTMPGAGDRQARPMEDLVLSHSDPATGLPVGPRDARPAGDYTSEELLAAVLASVDDDKAEDVVQIDLRGRSDVADYMVICSGRSSRQVASISEKLADRLKEQFRILAKMEGKETGDWVLIDSGDVIVHVFRPEVREFYQLEKMWMPGSAHRGA